MSDRLTRKEIKRQDTFQTTMVQSLEWVRRHRRKLIAGVATLALAIVALAGWALWVRLSEGDAQALLAEAMTAYAAPVRPDGEGAAAGDRELSFPSEAARRTRSQELFERVVKEHRASDAADVGRVYLGLMAADDGAAERARELWRDFIDEHPRHMLAAEVRLNLYALDRADGKAEEVAAELEAMLEDARRPLPEDVVLNELAVTLESLGRQEDAAEHYQRLVTEFAESPYAFAAREKVGASASFAGLGT